MHLIKRPAVFLCVACLALLVVGGGRGSARSPQQERKVKIRTFKNQPVEIVAVRNLQNGETWLRDLEVEVKNISDKPVYYFAVSLGFPDIPMPPPMMRADGTTPSKVEAGFKLRYGATRMVNLAELPTPEDVPLEPGRTYTFRVPDTYVEGLEHMKKDIGFGDEATMNLTLHISELNFGDGTGYIGGMLQSRPVKRRPKPKDEPPAEVEQQKISFTKTSCSRASTGDALFFRAGWLDTPLSYALLPKRAASRQGWCTGGCEKYEILENSPNHFCTAPDNSPCFRNVAMLTSKNVLCSIYTEKPFSCKGQPCSDDEINYEASANCAQPCADKDGDGYYPSPCGNDCDDNDRFTHPDALIGPCGGMQKLSEDRDCNGVNDYRELECPSPILLDVAGDGFALTDGAGGVAFDLDADGARERLSWTKAGSDDAWLALDRDGNGRVDSGRELFGNFSPQPAPPPGEEKNGFLALAEFDKPEGGGNGDGLIDRRDAVYASLRLWRDANHDGLSAAGELRTLPALDVSAVHLDYKESKRVDGHGNWFRYRAKVSDAKGAKVNRWAWDVFLVPGQ